VPQLLEILREHMPILRSQNLITDRPATFMRAADGSIVEIFEWKSPEAIEQAHANPAVREMWERFEKACEYLKLEDLAEAKQMFPGFEPLELN
jgi:hypothetical protein